MLDCRIVDQPFPLSIASAGYAPGILHYLFEVINMCLDQDPTLRLTLPAELGWDLLLLYLLPSVVRAHGCSTTEQRAFYK